MPRGLHHVDGAHRIGPGSAVVGEHQALRRLALCLALHGHLRTAAGLGCFIQWLAIASACTCACKSLFGCARCTLPAELVSGTPVRSERRSCRHGSEAFPADGLLTQLRVHLRATTSCIGSRRAASHVVCTSDCGSGWGCSMHT